MRKKGGEDSEEEKRLVAQLRQMIREGVTDDCSICLDDQKEKQLPANDLEMAALNRRAAGFEEDLEKTEEKMVAAVAKLAKAPTASDDN